MIMFRASCCKTCMAPRQQDDAMTSAHLAWAWSIWGRASRRTPSWIVAYGEVGWPRWNNPSPRGSWISPIPPSSNGVHICWQPSSLRWSHTRLHTGQVTTLCCLECCVILQGLSQLLGQRCACLPHRAHSPASAVLTWRPLTKWVWFPPLSSSAWAVWGRH